LDASNPYDTLRQRSEEGSPVRDERSSLIDEAVAVWAQPGFETFMCTPRLR